LLWETYDGQSQADFQHHQLKLVLLLLMFVGVDVKIEFKMITIFDGLLVEAKSQFNSTSNAKGNGVRKSFLVAAE